jgi:hypothetical protein
LRQDELDRHEREKKCPVHATGKGRFLTWYGRWIRGVGGALLLLMAVAVLVLDVTGQFEH